MNIEMYTCEIKITQTCQIVFFLLFRFCDSVNLFFCDLVNLLLSAVNSFMTEIPIIERPVH